MGADPLPASQLSVAANTIPLRFPAALCSHTYISAYIQVIATYPPYSHEELQAAKRAQLIPGEVLYCEVRGHVCGRGDV